MLSTKSAAESNTLTATMRSFVEREGIDDLGQILQRADLHNPCLDDPSIFLWLLPGC